MRFKSQPNLFVKISKPIIQRSTGLKGFSFDNNGEYETENEVLIKILKQNFEVAEKYKCKKCDYETDNKGELLAHYRLHKKEG